MQALITKGWNTPATDVSAMEFVHLDYYTEDATALQSLCNTSRF